MSVGKHTPGCCCEEEPPSVPCNYDPGPGSPVAYSLPATTLQLTHHQIWHDDGDWSKESMGISSNNTFDCRMSEEGDYSYPLIYHATTPAGLSGTGAPTGEMWISDAQSVPMERDCANRLEFWVLRCRPAPNAVQGFHLLRYFESPSGVIVRDGTHYEATVGISSGFGLLHDAGYSTSPVLMEWTWNQVSDGWSNIYATLTE